MARSIWSGSSTTRATSRSRFSPTTHGTVLAIGERDCSIQRRHQKLIEEAPAPNLPRKTRDALLRAAVKGAKAAGYTNAGTLEFLVDRDGNFYFMEMNTRIQVEHPVTEMTTGLDLVAWQIRIAAGQKSDADASATASRTGTPSNAGSPPKMRQRTLRRALATIEMYVAPGGPGVRVDSHLYAGYSVPPYYDSLLGKVIAWGRDRDEAAARMERALTETVITGVPQTVSFLRSIVGDEEFRSRGHMTPEFISASRSTGCWRRARRQRADLGSAMQAAATPEHEEPR